MNTEELYIVLRIITFFSFGVLAGGLLSIGNLTPYQCDEVPAVHHGWVTGLFMSISVILAWIIVACMSTSP